MNALLRRRAMMAARKKPLPPPEYQQVEWVASSGGQYIITSVLPSKTSTIIAKSGRPRNFLTLFGAGNSTADRAQLFCMSNTAMYLRPWSNSGIQLNGVLDTNDVEIDFANKKVEFNGVKSNITITYADQDILYPYAIFAQNIAGKISTIISCSIYAFEIKDGGETVLKLLPCYRKSDGEIGMYDTVSKTFYTNAGTGSFTKGADVN